MLIGKNLPSGRGKYLIGVLLLSTVALVGLAFFTTPHDEFNIAKREILLRRVGHELLLQSGDSTSTVLPVEKISKDEYQIRFEKSFAFQSDALVKITQIILAHDPYASDYVVNVLKTSEPGVAYAYAISNNQDNNLISCVGRKQAFAPYVLSVKFKPPGMNNLAKGYLLGCLPVLAFVGFMFWRNPKLHISLPKTIDPASLNLGSILFNTSKRELSINGHTIALTGTETRVLQIFALSPNVMIERSRLQKEIWEDEGVIVGRSLDMFISKLRKKLALDPDIKIAVIRGKGYRLEIGG
ncbi:winged helix-turn-helix domain-containing protein [Pedobacter sandarakinus]|uniref:winged helix-turn-helix domain-containing protein n=1 Tax=Pedobacter sandarakinus TaxID=353156 RepID=UPI0022468351|nr:winged helix-turn-helix domain-containing protein [Pedobacter sandarakinus]MCX2574079.1 winged helix-turn-helix domain-containing protein [Pedobacter sandarakinus]